MRLPLLLRRLRESQAASTMPQLQRGGAVREADPTDVAPVGSTDDVDTTDVIPEGTSPGADVPTSEAEPADVLDSDATTEPDAGETDGDTIGCTNCAATGSMPDGAECPECDGTGRIKRTREAAPAQQAVKLGSAFHLLREAAKTASGAYEVVLLEEGLGNLGDMRYYTKDSLKRLVESGIIEGLQAYADHPTRTEERELPERSIKALVGSYSKARYREAGGTAQIVAQFDPIGGQSYQWVRDLIESAIQRSKEGLPPLVGISIDGGGIVEEGELPDGRRVDFVREVAFLPSADIVTRPGAGGKFVSRLTESLRHLDAPSRPGTTTPRKEPSMKLKLKELQDQLTAATAKLRESAVQLREAKDEESVAAAVTSLDGQVSALDELGKADVEREVEFRESAPKDGYVPLVKFREAESARDTAVAERDSAVRERDQIKGEKDTLDRTLLAAKTLRESKTPEDSYKFWFDDLVKCEDEAGMKAFITRKGEEEKATVARVRESLGLSDFVEGAPVRAPVTEITDDVGALERAGIPITEPEAAVAE